MSDFKSEWISQGLTKEAITFAFNLGEELAKNKLETSQIRNIFGEVRRMEMKQYNHVHMLLLKPRLAYAAARKGTKGVQRLRTEIELAMDVVISQPEANLEFAFRNFAAFFESILAYHKYHEGMHHV